MLWSRLVTAAVSCVLVGNVGALTVDEYVAKQGPIAKVGLLANIGAEGPKSHGAAPGVVVASPSEADPDYVFTWIRDASLVFQAIIDQYTNGLDASLRPLIDVFVASQSKIQQISNPSGSIATGGLGEPKFMINETAFTGSWGRPQRDGPALRSTALISWANHLLANNNQSYVSEALWPIIKLDLDYTQQSWNQSTFDLWEELSGASYFTSAAQHKALRVGVTLAQALGNIDETVLNGYTEQADNILCFMQSYWNPTSSYMTANVPNHGRSGLDSNTVLTSIHSYDPTAGCDSITLQPCSDKALANLFAYVNEFREGATKGGEYAINKGKTQSQAVAVGRYPEDVYFGGHPWYLSTLAVSEQLYYALDTWAGLGSLEVTPLSLPFFQSIIPDSSSLVAGTYAGDSQVYIDLTTAVKAYAEGFVEVVATYTPEDGSLAEQYNRVSGTPLSATDLTWSYASALTAFQARAGVAKPHEWGAKGLTVKTGADGQCIPGPAPITVDVTFNVNAETTPGENIFVVGSVDALKQWDTNSAVALDASAYPKWSVTLKIPVTTRVEYKYIRKSASGDVTWESDPNRSIVTPEEGQNLVLDDVWK